MQNRYWTELRQGLIFSTSLLLSVGDPQLEAARPMHNVVVIIDAFSWVFPDTVRTDDLGNDGYMLAATPVDPARMPPPPVVRSIDGGRYTSHVVALEMEPPPSS